MTLGLYLSGQAVEKEKGSPFFLFLRLSVGGTEKGMYVCMYLGQVAYSDERCHERLFHDHD